MLLGQAPDAGLSKAQRHRQTRITADQHHPYPDPPAARTNHNTADLDQWDRARILKVFTSVAESAHPSKLRVRRIPITAPDRSRLGVPSCGPSPPATPPQSASSVPNDVRTADLCRHPSKHTGLSIASTTRSTGAWNGSLEARDPLHALSIERTACPRGRRFKILRCRRIRQPKGRRQYMRRGPAPRLLAEMPKQHYRVVRHCRDGHHGPSSVTCP